MNNDAVVKNFKQGAPVEISGSLPICPQCGMMHPPLKTGEHCPNAPEKTKDGDVISFEHLFTQIKAICISQIKSKEIKDVNKLFAKVILVLTKEIENYKE